MKIWYDNYIFSPESNESVYNPCGVLYFIKRVVSSKGIPHFIVDDNLRMDYSKLSSLVVQSKQINGNFDVLTEILTKGSIDSRIVKSFPFSSITDRAKYISLLYFLGLLTYSKDNEKGSSILVIPNETIKKLVFDYMQECMNEAYGFNLDVIKLENHIKAMAESGDFVPAIEFIAKDIDKITSNKDLRVFGEETLKTMFLIYLNIYDTFLVFSEKEMNKGVADMVLIPDTSQYPKLKYAYLIEFKYIKRGEGSGFKLKRLIKSKVSQAKEQLDQYSENEKTKRLFKIV
jgi:hypothetical protein